MVADTRWVHALGLRLDEGWWRLPPAERCAEVRAFTGAVRQQAGVRTHCYSMAGLRGGVDLLLWRLGSEPEALEESTASSLRCGFGRWLGRAHSFIGTLSASPYVHRRPEREPALFDGDRSRYLIVYPFVKATSWYAMGHDLRQGIMAEHIRVGRSHPEVRQLLASSFGVDDGDFLVAYETDDAAGFSSLVEELRATRGRQFTASDTPVLVGVHRSLDEIGQRLGAA